MTKLTHDMARKTFRKCLSSGESMEKSALIRFVVGPDHMLVPDILGKLPGRGLWVASSRDAVTQAAQKGLFAKSAKVQVNVPVRLLDDIEEQLARRCISLLSLARKAGYAVAGYEKVKDWLSKDVAQVLMQSSDGSTRGKSKLSTPYRGMFIGWLTSQELGMAFGRQSAVHCALASGGMSQRVVNEAQRLKGFREIKGDLRIAEWKRQLNER